MDEFSTKDLGAIDAEQKHLNIYEDEVNAPGASKDLMFHVQNDIGVFEKKIFKLDNSRNKTPEKETFSNYLDVKIEDQEECKIEVNSFKKPLTPSLSKRSIMDCIDIQVLSQSRLALLIDLTQKFKNPIEELWNDMVYKLDVASNKRELISLMRNMASKNNESYKIIFVVHNSHLYEESLELVNCIRSFEVKNSIPPSKICPLGM
jgi:hypothetical protein